MTKNYKQIWDSLSTTSADAAHFVGYTESEEETRANGAITASFLRDVLQIGPDDRILEIGCGIARIGRELAPYCREWHGADISGNMISYARSRTEGIPNLYLHELPESNLDIFADGYFDCVYSSIVFMHLDKVEVFRYILDAYRVLAPGGRAYFDTYNLLAPEAWQQFSDVVRNYSAGKRPGHVSQFSTPQELEKYIQEAHFQEIHIDAQNAQLVVALGRKPGETPSDRPSSPLRARPAPQNGKVQTDDPSDDATFREWKVLSDNLRAKDQYIATLEETLAAKNGHIEKLEHLMRSQQRSMSNPLVRAALRLTRRRQQ